MVPPPGPRSPRASGAGGLGPVLPLLTPSGPSGPIGPLPAESGRVHPCTEVPVEPGERLSEPEPPQALQTETIHPARPPERATPLSQDPAGPRTSFNHKYFSTVWPQAERDCGGGYWETAQTTPSKTNSCARSLPAPGLPSQANACA